MSYDYSTYAILIKSNQDHKVEMQHRVFLLNV
jgi:hypothetical protein